MRAYLSVRSLDPPVCHCPSVAAQTGQRRTSQAYCMIPIRFPFRLLRGFLFFPLGRGLLFISPDLCIKRLHKLPLARHVPHLVFIPLALHFILQPHKRHCHIIRQQFIQRFRVLIKAEPLRLRILHNAVPHIIRQPLQCSGIRIFLQAPPPHSYNFDTRTADPIPNRKKADQADSL